MFLHSASAHSIFQSLGTSGIGGCTAAATCPAALSPNVPTRIKPHQLAARGRSSAAATRDLHTCVVSDRVQHSHEHGDPSSCCTRPTKTADSPIVSWSICQATAVHWLQAPSGCSSRTSVASRVRPSLLLGMLLLDMLSFRATSRCCHVLFRFLAWPHSAPTWLHTQLPRSWPFSLVPNCSAPQRSARLLQHHLTNNKATRNTTFVPTMSLSPSTSGKLERISIMLCFPAP